MKRVLALTLMVVMLCTCLLSIMACGKRGTCTECGKTWTGKAYYGFFGDETFCSDCARAYWTPLPYEQYEIE